MLASGSPWALGEVGRSSPAGVAVPGVATHRSPPWHRGDRDLAVSVTSESGECPTTTGVALIVPDEKEPDAWTPAQAETPAKEGDGPTEPLEVVVRARSTATVSLLRRPATGPELGVTPQVPHLPARVVLFTRARVSCTPAPWPDRPLRGR